MSDFWAIFRIFWGSEPVFYVFFHVFTFSEGIIACFERVILVFFPFFRVFWVKFVKSEKSWFFVKFPESDFEYYGRQSYKNGEIHFWTFSGSARFSHFRLTFSSDFSKIQMSTALSDGQKSVIFGKIRVWGWLTWPIRVGKFGSGRPEVLAVFRKSQNFPKRSFLDFGHWTYVFIIKFMRKNGSKNTEKRDSRIFIAAK